MATIFKSTGSLTNSSDVDAMKVLISNYWGGEEREKSFPISLWKLNQLFSAASSEEVALRVKNIDDPLLVDADWIVFEEEFEELLQGSDAQPNTHYFVLNESSFEEIKNSLGSTPSHKVIMLGRIALEREETVDLDGDPVTTIKYFVFFYPAEYKIISPGTGGGGAAGGIKVPIGG